MRADPGRKVDINVMEGIEATADHRLIEIVLSNLLGNAWKFTSKTENAQIEFGAIENLHPAPLRRGDCLLRQGQRLRVQPGVQREDVPALPPAPFRQRVRGHGNRPCHRRADHPPPRRQSVGGGRSRQRGHGLFYAGVKVKGKKPPILQNVRELGVCLLLHSRSLMELMEG